MSLTQQLIYTLNKLSPFLFPEVGRYISRPVQASQNILKGSPLGMVVTATNAVQTLSISGTPTGGTFRLTYNGFTTANIAFNASAATVQAALEALASVGTGNVVCSGGALPGTAVVVTFQNSLAGQPVPAITIANNSLTGGTTPTPSIAQTTVGVRAGGLRAWTGTLVSAPATPTVSTVAGGTFFGDGTNNFAFSVSVTFYNESGETTPSTPQQAIVTSANRTIRIAQYTGLAATIQGARYYVNGQLAAQTVASGGTIAQTDIITGWTTPFINPPEVNGCFAVRDGSHILRGFALCDFATDTEGRVTLGQVNTGMEQGQELLEAPYYIEGYFRIGDLGGVDATNFAQLSRFGRFISGDTSSYLNATEAVFRIG